MIGMLQVKKKTRGVYVVINKLFDQTITFLLVQF